MLKDPPLDIHVPRAEVAVTGHHSRAAHPAVDAKLGDGVVDDVDDVLAADIVLVVAVGADGIDAEAAPRLFGRVRDEGAVASEKLCRPRREPVALDVLDNL